MGDEDFTEWARVSNNIPRGTWSDGEVIYVADESDDKVYSYNMLTVATLSPRTCRSGMLARTSEPGGPEEVR